MSYFSTQKALMDAKKLNKVTVKEYLQIERESRQRYEFHDGFIFALAGGTLNHGLICGNVFGEIRSWLKEKKSPCKAMSSEVKLHIQSEKSFLYPDTMVVCGDIEKSKIDPNAVANPVLIVEVLSKTTSAYDRGDKFYLYRQIPGLQEYMLIEQDKAQAEVYKRESGLWRITRVSGLDKSVPLSSIGLEISLADIYRDVEFPGEEE